MQDNNSCFCELAALNALDLLEEPDRQTLEDYQTECPELAVERVAFEEAIAAIPYSAPVVPLNADLKRQLFQRINREPAQLQPQPPARPRIPIAATLKSGFWQMARKMLKQLTQRKRLAVRSHDLIWMPYQVSGVTVAPLHIDIVKREVVALLRAEAGVSYPSHRHAIAEEIYMLEGDLTIDGEVYGAGDYIRSLPGSTHTPSTVGGCMFFVRTSLDDKYPN